MKKKILIVDDEEDIRISVKQAVESEGYQAKTARDAIQGLQILRKESFDLVLLDIFMPEMSGRDMLEEIRKDEKLKDQKVAFLTVANLSETGRGIINKLKPVDYFQKPVDLDDLSKRLKKILK